MRHSHSPTPLSSTPVALTIAGSDSSSGAGIQADLKTFTAFGVYGLTAVTCIVAEAPARVSKIEPVTAGTVQEQIKVVARSFPIGAIKTGLLCNSEVVKAVASALRMIARNEEGHVPLVVDPVMVATSGAELLDPEGLAAYEEHLFPLATLITPNMDEAGKLLGRSIADGTELECGARELATKYGTNILLKGGHLRDGAAIDILCCGGTVTRFAAPFVNGVSTHGTGCTYSAAITAGLARRLSLQDAISRAKEFVTQSIAEYLSWGDVHALKHWR